MATQMTIEGASLFHEIGDRGYAELEHGIPNEWIERLIEAYGNFTTALPDPEIDTMDCMLPGTDVENRLDELRRSADTQSEWHKYRTNVPGFGKPNGYTNRSFQASVLERTRLHEISEDPKEYYHYAPTHMDAMAQTHRELGWGEIPPEVFELSSAFAPIHAKAGNLILKTVSQIEERHPEIAKLEIPAHIYESPLRLIFYHPSDQTQLASGHYDKGCLTLQIAESHQGLRVAKDSDSPLQDIDRAPTKAVFFSSVGVGDALEGEHPFQPAWHDVVARDDENQGRFVPASSQAVCARWSLIFFANGTNQNFDIRNRTHKR